MKLLVTGGCGFIGSHFIRHLLSKYNNYEIINLDNLDYCATLKNTNDFKNNSNYKFIKGNICNLKTVDNIAKNVDIIINFAAQTHVDNSISNPAIFANTNILGTINLLNAAKKYDIKKFLQISTDEVYGANKTGYFDEKSNLNPTNPYSISKASADMYALAYFKTYNVPVIITRSSNNFGENQYPEKIIPYFISQLLQNKKVPLYSSGMQKRDWLYVKDNCEAIDLVLHKGNIGEVYNISSHTEKTNLEITNFLIKYLNKSQDLIVHIKDRPQHDFRYGITNDKIINLGWKNNNNFKENLIKTIKWNIENQNYFIQ